MVTATYDALGRMRTKTDESGYTLTFEYDDMDRLTKITHPDSTFEQFTYDRLDVTHVRDRAGRQTLFEYDNVRQMKKQTDPLGRVTLFEWCRCGQHQEPDRSDGPHHVVAHGCARAADRQAVRRTVRRSRIFTRTPAAACGR